MTLAVSDPHADVLQDVHQLAAEVLSHGANRTQVLATEGVILDASEPHDDRCRCPGNLMSPPFSPAPPEFARWLEPFDIAILAEVDEALAGAAWRQGGPGWRCRWHELRSDPGHWSTVGPAWRRLHDVTMWLEREAMRRGYYLSVGFGAGDCELCEVCDTAQLCIEPYAARPSMEAVGIDVAGTRRAAGWPEAPTDGVTLTAILLLV